MRLPGGFQRSKLRVGYGPAGEIFGTWGAYKGRLMGINLQPCSDMEPESAIPGRGHARHFFYQRDSGVMRSIDDTELAAAAEAEAVAR